MKNILFILFASLLLNTPLYANLLYLTKRTEPRTALENVTTNFVADSHEYGSNDDAVDEDVPIGFTFNFNDTNYTQLNIDSNGHLAFVNITSEYTNKELPRSNREHSIYPYWDDLNIDLGGSIKYGTLGSGDDQHFVVWWDSVPHYDNSSSSYSFQVILYKNGSIRFRYADGDTDGNSATVGVQEDSTYYDQHTFNDTSSFDSTLDILYEIPTPPSQATGSINLGICDDFEGGLANWSTTGRVSTTQNTYSSATHSMSINGGNSDATTAAIDTVDNLKELRLWVRRGADSFSEDTDNGEDLILEYLDSGNNWVELETFLGSGTKGQIYKQTYSMPSSAEHANFKIRFNMPNGNGSGYDYWHIDDVCLIPDRYSTISKSSCVISDPINGTTNPKRIPGSTLRYAIEVSSIANNAIDNVTASDTLDSSFDYSSIRNLQIRNGDCDCLGVSSASNNGANGSSNAEHPVVLDFGSIAAGSRTSPTRECGYFEVDIS